MSLAKLLQEVWFVFFDFDNCLAQTFKPSPNQVDVVTAYNLALLDIFGPSFFAAKSKGKGEDKVMPLDLIDGLQNRTPAEIMSALMKWSATAGQNKHLTSLIKTALKANKELWDGQVPKGKGVPLQWPQESEPDQVLLAAEMITRAKLNILLREIGPDWPLPSPGVIDFFSQLAQKQQKMNLVTGIISSGHEIFIRNTFKTWGIECPDLIITDDDVRSFKYQVAKPDPSILDMLLVQWLSSQNKGLQSLQQERKKILLTALIKRARARTIYFGDDPIKDGLLAKKAGAKFGWFNPEGLIDEDLGDHFTFENWRQVPDLLEWE